MLERLLLAAALVAALIIGTYAARRLYRRWQWSRARGMTLGRTGVGQVLYFTTPHCAQCRYYQEPELDRLVRGSLGRVVVRKEDARTSELARRFSILTVPSTVVVDAMGRVVAVNNGPASAEQLMQQLGLEHVPQGARSGP